MTTNFAAFLSLKTKRDILQKAATSALKQVALHYMEAFCFT